MNATRPGDDHPVDRTTGTLPAEAVAGTDPHPSTPDPADAAPRPGDRSGRASGAGGRDLPAGYEPL
ncbi:hypothetical protein ACIOD2_41150 [Amycolatopsis sp. NPDC088138]|uniref:hypothetical protein n=1 Tax=Amycolatopsis sp. NPDC088138 TaxID=3363938 RepID=UPI0037FC5C56